MRSNLPELTALLVSPDRELADAFTSTLARTHAFQILSDLRSYPSSQTLDMRLRQLRPDVLLIDLGSSLETAAELIRFAAALPHPPQVVGLHKQNDSRAILLSLRMGASEFLHAPFDVDVQREAISRLRRLRQPEPETLPDPGTVVVFSSAKPGAGASTVAIQTAFALQRAGAKRVLLADLDLMGGTIGFYLKLNHDRSAIDALESANQLSPSLWSTLVADSEGIDVLPAPDAPFAGGVDSTRLHAVIEYVRMNYEWVLIDVPVVFQRLSLMAISESDRAFLISTSELPSLHLARKAVKLLDQLGFPKDRFQVVMNRVDKRDELGGTEIEKLFNCTVHSRIPNDYFSLHRSVTLGQSVDGHSELGKAIQAIAAKLMHVDANVKPKNSELKPALARA
jgi:pilus assembly protein CpaE